MNNLSKAKIFLILCLCLIAGVGGRSIFSLTPLVGYVIVLICGIILILFWLRKKIRLICFCLLAVLVGFWRYDLAVPKVKASDIQFYNGQNLRFLGVVSAEPDQRQDHVKLTIKVIKGLDIAPSTVKGKVLIKSYLYPEYQYGDLLEINCRLQAPQKIEYETDEGSRSFAYDKYLARFGIYSVCYQPGIKLVGYDYGNVIMKDLLSVKKRFIEAIQRSLPDPQASFLGGLVLGAKRSIPNDLMAAFSRTGTTHIVALSGYNITIIAVLIFNLCNMAWVPRKKSFWVSLAAITFFVLITGAPASVVRAGIMGLLVLLAQNFGRLSRITNALVLAAVAMLLINPKILVFDTGFQLSFLATLGLVYLAPLLERILVKVPSFFSLKQNLTATLSAIIMTSPLILFQFGRFSLLAPLVNLLILPVVPLSMGLGFINGLLAMIWLPLGQVFGWLTWLVLSYMIFVVEKFSSFKFASWQAGQIGWWWLIFIYSSIIVVILKIKKTPMAGDSHGRSDKVQ